MFSHFSHLGLKFMTDMGSDTLHFMIDMGSDTLQMGMIDMDSLISRIAHVHIMDRCRDE